MYRRNVHWFPANSGQEHEWGASNPEGLWVLTQYMEGFLPGDKGWVLWEEVMG